MFEPAWRIPIEHGSFASMSEDRPGRPSSKLLESLLDDVEEAHAAERAADCVNSLVEAVRVAARNDAAREAESRAEIEAGAAAEAAKVAAARTPNESATRNVISAVVAAARKTDHASAPPAPNGQPDAPQRIRRPKERFRVEDLLDLDTPALLALVTQVEPLDLVVVCASRGAGALTDRLLALLPEGTRQALFEAIKAAGITPEGEAEQALQRVATLVKSLESAR